MPSAIFRKIKRRNGKVTTPLSRSVYHVTPRKPNIRDSLGREHGKLSKYDLNTCAIEFIKQFELILKTDFPHSTELFHLNKSVAPSGHP